MGFKSAGMEELLCMIRFKITSQMEPQTKSLHSPYPLLLKLHPFIPTYLDDLICEDVSFLLLHQSNFPSQ
jgi:hypothetical protein